MCSVMPAIEARWTTVNRAASHLVSFVKSVRAALLFLTLATAAACGAAKSPVAPSPPTAPGLPTGFTLIGDAESVSGATWAYRATVAGIAYDLQGILFKPRGAGRFPAVIVSHAHKW
jgi:hypothetical protein